MKRRWFQIHLSTAVVLMLVAGVLLWANMQPNFSIRFVYIGFERLPFGYFLTTYGWPVAMRGLVYDPKRKSRSEFLDASGHQRLLQSIDSWNRRILE